MSIVCLFRAPLKISFTEWTPCLKITITITTFEVSPNTTTFQMSHNMTSDDNVSRHLDVGTDYIISVCSVNSVGCSETVSTSLGMYCTGG